MSRGRSAGSVRVDVVASNAKFDKAIKQSRTRLQRFQQSAARIARKIQGSWKAVGAAIAGVGIAIGAGIKKMASYSASVVEVSRSVGLTTKELENLRVLMEGDGIGIKKADRALKDFNVRVGFAQRGIGQYTRAFEELGVELRNADGSFKSNSTLLTEVAGKLKTNTDHATAASIAYELFGTSGRDLLPILQKYGKGLDEASKKAGRFNTLSDEQHKKNKALDQSLMELKKNLVDLAYRVMADYADELTIVVDKFNKWLEGIKAGHGTLENFIDQMERTANAAGRLSMMTLGALAGMKIGGGAGLLTGAGALPMGALGAITGGAAGFLFAGTLQEYIKEKFTEESVLLKEELAKLQENWLYDEPTQAEADRANAIRARLKEIEEEKKKLEELAAAQEKANEARSTSTTETKKQITLTQFLDNNKARRTAGGFAGYSTPAATESVAAAKRMSGAMGFTGGMLADDWSSIQQAIGAGDHRASYKSGGGLQVPFSYGESRFHPYRAVANERRGAFQDSFGINKAITEAVERIFRHPDLRDRQKSGRTRGEFYNRWGSVGGLSSGGGSEFNIVQTEVMPGMVEWAARTLSNRLNAQKNTSIAGDGGAWMNQQLSDIQTEVMPGMIEWAAKTLAERLKTAPISSELGGDAYARQLLQSRLQSGVTGGRIYGSEAINNMKNWDNRELERTLEGLKSLSDELRVSFSDFTHSLVSDFKNAGEAAKQLARDILKIGTQRMIVNPAANWLFGAADGSDGGGLFGAMASAFTGAFADGGHAKRGLALVGERGPEIVDFQKPGMVYSNEQLAAAMSGGKGNITIQYNISSTDGPGVKAALAAATPGIVQTARATVMEDSTRIGGFQQAVQGGR